MIYISVYKYPFSNDIIYAGISYKKAREVFGKKKEHCTREIQHWYKGELIRAENIDKITPVVRPVFVDFEEYLKFLKDLTKGT